MNKERARENIKKLKEVVEQYNKMIVPPQKECSVYIGEDTLYLNDEMLESLDIATESLDNEWVDVRDRLPDDDGTYLVCQQTLFGLDYEILKWWKYNHKWGYRNKKCEVIAWKKVEPYKRKE